MKTMFKSIMVRTKAFLTIYAVISVFTICFGQSMPGINVRFANPHFDDNTRMYFLDVELNANESKESLFGMNVRFFYDATMLEFQELDQFSAGYTPLGESRATQAAGQAGSQMFSLHDETVFINAAIQLSDGNAPLQILPEKWVKAFRVAFKVPLIYTGKGEFCPSVIWDIKGVEAKGGFLAGDDGLILTVLDNNPGTEAISAPSHVNGQFFNWEPSTAEGMPYGKPNAVNCVIIGETVSTQDHDTNKGFALFQNEPNPFNRGTKIEFILPSPLHVTLKFYDVSGKEVNEINGDYKTGRNSVKLDRLPWMEESKVIFYRMEAEGFRSNTLKMVLIDE